MKGEAAVSRPAKSHASGVRHTHLTVMSRSHAYLCQISRLFLILTHCHTHSSLGLAGPPAGRSAIQADGAIPWLWSIYL